VARLVRLLVLAALVAGTIAYLRRRQTPATARVTPTWPPLTDAAPPQEPVLVAAEPGAPEPVPWVPANAGACPDGYPVKVKVASGIYHLPGMAVYDRTMPDRCYATAGDAEADGYRPSRR
jgi:hypothetical protein